MKEIDLFENIIENKEIFLFPIKISTFSKPQRFYSGYDLLTAANYNSITKAMEILDYEGCVFFEGNKLLAFGDLPYIVRLAIHIYHELWHEQVYSFTKTELVTLAKAGGWYGNINNKLTTVQNLTLRQLHGKENMDLLRIDNNGEIRKESMQKEQDFIEYIVWTLTDISMYSKIRNR